jgi:hypothetical protein
MRDRATEGQLSMALTVDISKGFGLLGRWSNVVLQKIKLKAPNLRV